MKLRSWLLAVAVATGVSAPVAGPLATACAEEPNRAALVVDTGRGPEPFAMCVDLGDEKSVSGLELIELAHDQFGLQYRFGYGGRAVCQLANVPEERPPEECFEDAEEFWGYWIGDGSGGWQTSSQGAGSTTVEGGDVQGWSYGPGREASTHPKPRNRADGSQYTFESICAEIKEKDRGDPQKKQPEDDGNDQDERDAGSAPDTNTSNGSKPDAEKMVRPAPSPEPEPDARLIDSAPDVSELELAITPTPSRAELPASATSAESDDTSQPPIAGILALLATMGMAGVAVYLVRKRASEQEE